jgi:APA family basic amino acid/polyamine antiporter
VARKVQGFERVLGTRSLAAVAYSELGASIYVALGIVAGQALGLTPVVLLASGLLILLVSVSYAEGITAIPETGGAATFTRRAFNDVTGFATGWVLFLDYLIVIALSALFLPHYLGAAVSVPEITESPWDVVAAVFVILMVVVYRLVRSTRVSAPAIALAGLDLAVQALVIVLGFALLFSPDVLVDGLGFAGEQDWRDLAFALPLAMLAYTGLETVANLSEEARDPGRTLPRALFPAIGLVVVLTALIGAVGITALPVEDGETALGTDWLTAPLIGIVTAFDGDLPATVVDGLRIAVGISGALLLLAAVTASVSGCTRLAHSLAEHGMLPRELARFERRALVSSEAILATGVTAIAVVIGASVLAQDEATFLASAYSFGVTLAFTAAQLAILRLRRIEPDLPRPFLARPEIAFRGTRYPVVAIVGAPLTFGVFVLAIVTHPGARYAGPAWLAIGAVIYLVVRVRGRHGLLVDVNPVETLPEGAQFRRVLVPMKLGDIGEEMVATAVALAKERGATVEAIFVAAVTREFSLEAPLPPDVQARADASLAEAQALGEDNGVEVATSTIVARSIGHAIVEEATRRNVDLIVLGSAPRWRRQSRFFSPTVDHVVRCAPCEVLVVAFPEGVFEE